MIRKDITGLAILALISAVFAMGQTPGVEEPLEAPADEFAAMIESPIITASDGSRRFEGQLMLIAEDSFDTQVLKSASPSLELLAEDPPDQFKRRMLLVRVPESEIARVTAFIGSLNGIRSVDGNIVLTAADTPNDPMWPVQQYAGAYLLNMERAWDITRGRSSVRVAVIDTGVNAVPDLYPQLDPGVNVLSEPYTSDVTDQWDHGTDVASIIAATHDNGAQITGISPSVHIVPVKACALQYPGEIACAAPNIYRALVWLSQQPSIDVINLSFSGPGSEFGVTAVEEYLEYLTGPAGHFMIVAAAAGNDGEGEVEWPANYQPPVGSNALGVIAVGGVNPDGSRHPSSNYGAELDFSAPFTTIALSQFGYPQQFSGTSAATPFVSGLAALYKSEYPIELQVQFSFQGVAGFTNQSEWNSQTGRGVTDAWKMLWYGGCFRFDLDHDRDIDLSDAQKVAFHFGSFLAASTTGRRTTCIPRLPATATWTSTTSSAYSHATAQPAGSDRPAENSASIAVRSASSIAFRPASLFATCACRLSAISSAAFACAAAATSDAATTWSRNPAAIAVSSGA